MSDKKPSLGDFHFRNVAASYEPNLALLMPDQPFCGVALQSQYLYGGLTSESGVTYVLERKFIGPMSGGNYVLTNRSGTMDLAPESGRTAKGELVRKFEPDKRHWASKGMLHDSAELPIDLTITDDVLTWSEGDALDLSGTRPAYGVQFYAPMRDEPLAYASQPYWVTGTILGEKCEGPLFFDHLYFRHGVEWKEYRWYTDLQVSWNVFANKFEDGSVEWGHIVRGRQDWSVGAVMANDEELAMCTDVRGDFTLDDEGYVAEADYDCGPAGTWTFTGDPTQTLAGFNNARWGGYRAQGGTTRRKGDDRAIVGGWTWLECFADRITSEGLLRQP
ncbi:Uncharacterised protein [Mycolicibacterium vanbaalenii]|uniref:Uncharacterized protein n=1 Tax=Mycolicibacterium vanbaalenii TaxID=110539 RepID=A0A5S9PNR4_MYCVN|nr:hypothetical protein [Mycolicibacterium vanbaalenii]CAA0105935.1 Uncharacterised protein [Mycolicibacterium vanbaalenii]